MPQLSTYMPLTSSPPSPEDAARELFWTAYEESVEKEGDRVGDYSTTTMNGTLTFAGLFGALVGAFVIESLKMLSPDSAAQAVELNTQTVALLSMIALSTSSNRTIADAAPAPPLSAIANGTLGVGPQDFHVPRTAVVVNCLWLISLVIALSCALLATMIQEWTRRFLRGEKRRAHESKQRFAVTHMSSQMSAEIWALDHAPSIVVGLIHVALFMFFAGLDVLLFSTHPVVATTVTTVTGIVMLLYVTLSSVPLVDVTCPYSTPFTFIFGYTIFFPMAAIAVLGTYCLLLAAAAHCVISKGSFPPAFRHLLRPVMWIKLTVNPAFASKAVVCLWNYVLRRSSGEFLVFLPHVMHQLFNAGTTSLAPTHDLHRGDELEQTHDLQQGDELELMHELQQREGDQQLVAPGFREQVATFIWKHIGPFALENPPALQFYALNLVTWNPRVSELFAGFRTDKRYIAAFAASMGSTQSVFAAMGTLRLLHMLFQGENPFDRWSLPEDREEDRWALMDPIIHAFRAFAEQVGTANEDALRMGDTHIIEAVTSLRWLLVRLLTVTRVAILEPNARTRIVSILKDLDRIESLRLKPLMDTDAGTIEELFELDTKSICTQLAYRNTLTLTVAANACNWPPSWRNPDGRYLPKHTPGSLRWNVLCPDAHRRRQKPPASGFFREFLTDVGLDDWKARRSDLRKPSSSRLPHAAVEVLRTMALAVNLRMRRDNDEREMPVLSTSVVQPSYQAPINQFFDVPLGYAEEGNGGTERHVLRATSRRSPVELTPRPSQSRAPREEE